MQTVHWLGTGLSTVPGIRRLAQGALPLVLWNRTVAKAERAVAGLDKPVKIRKFELDAVAEAIQAGDIVVSMLPGNWHAAVAAMCVDKGAHFVSSSYIAPEIRALDEPARRKGLCLVNEVGLDPGIDHLMAHALVDDYKRSVQYDPGNAILFRSYCGGFPSRPNAFRYKFSWSPLGVLKALKSPSRSIRDGKTVDVQRPWHAVSDYTASLPGGRRETFEAYPNRDALPFMAEYNFDPDWDVREFVRGTLRLSGWSSAWQDIFREIETLSGESGEKRLQEMSDELWRTQAYDEGEPDRVVLCVELEARKGGTPVWHQSYAIDARGNENGSAMARLVSLTVSLAVEAVAAGRIAPGVSAAPADRQLVQQWLQQLGRLGGHIEHIDHLA